MPSTGLPSTSFGPVQPFGVRKTIAGQDCAPRVLHARGVLELGDAVERGVENLRETAVELDHVLVVEAAREEERLVAVAPQERFELVLEIRASTVGLAIL